MLKNITQKYYLLLFTSISLLLITTIVYAENAENTELPLEETTTTTENIPETFSTSTTENFSTSTNEVETKGTTTPKKEIRITEKTIPEISLNQNTQIRLTNLCANISNRLEAGIARHENIILRLESRIEKMKSQNFDTTKAEGFLSLARENISLAKDKIENIDFLVNQFVTSPTPRASWPSLKSTYLETGDLLQQSQTELKNTINSLKNTQTLPTQNNTGLETGVISNQN